MQVSQLRAHAADGFGERRELEKANAAARLELEQRAAGSAAFAERTEARCEGIERQVPVDARQQCSVYHSKQVLS